MKPTKQARREGAQLFRTCLVDGVLSDSRILEVVQQVIAAKPRGYLNTLGYFRRLVELDRARHTASVESALPLPAELRTKLESDLARLYGPQLSISYSENPALIGGMRIQVGSDVYDGSVRSRLAALEQNF